MEIVGIIVAIIALVVSLASAVIAKIALKEQIRVSQLTANYTAVVTADALLFNHKELLSLYNITDELLEKSGVTHIELLYLADSFQAAELYHRIDSNKPVILGKYRENLLRNEKVQKAWKNIIRDKFSSHLPFAEAVSDFIDSEQKAKSKSEESKVRDNLLHNSPVLDDAPNKSLDVRAKQRLS